MNKNDLDSLILQAEQDIENSKKRLQILKALKIDMGLKHEAVSTDEAALMLGISSRSVRTMLNDGRLRGYKPDKNWRVYMDSIREVQGLESICFNAY